MAYITKAIHYPIIETDVIPYYDNAEKKLVLIYAAKYNIEADMMTKITTHNTNIKLTIDKARSDRETAQKSTTLKNQELTEGKEDLLWVFRKIVASDNFDEADAQDLGFRVEKEPVNLDTVKPVISEITCLPEKIIFDWVKWVLDGVIVDGSYDGDTWAYLDKDNKSPFEDFRKNKTADVPEVRYYRFRYIKDDAPVGLYTEVIRVIAEIY